MSTDTTLITPVVASQVLHEYGHPGGYEAGGFMRGLIALIARADPFNRRKLALGFPEYVAAVEEIETPGGGVETLQAIAAKISETEQS